MMAGEGGQRAAAAIRRLYPRGQRNCGFLRRYSALFGFRLFCRSAALPRRAGGLALEARTAATREPLWRARLRVLKESFFQWVANRYDLTIGPLNAKRYRTELSLNADYRRFDDTLRLVVDSTEAMPVIHSALELVCSAMTVPADSGLLVFLIRRGIPRSTAGIMV